MTSRRKVASVHPDWQHVTGIREFHKEALAWDASPKRDAKDCLRKREVWVHRGKRKGPLSVRVAAVIGDGLSRV